ncbi:recombination-associated protein RdgC [Ramlibacter sp. H39-3-26]|uniref:recombination-associated protein RdgC n=1 Tax=Curvibacter soli TaxID=3031331 RepID=UPI0023D9F530|nr:recombination-associated protein RdgC [Ramlibacter sp. H39-3-26]MDF1485653.1 recombination-associated protein RdgC [Ramlibacter sp. H39-3-26]
MFKNVIVYRIAAGWASALAQMEEALQGACFVPCGATQEQSSGWVPPRGDAHGPLVESVGGQWIMKFMVEVRMLPASVLKRRVEERAAQIEAETGRKPGKKEMRDIRDEARLDLLPMAFTKQASVPVWLDAQAGWLVVGAASQSRADAVTTALVERCSGLSLALLDTQLSPQAAMAQWLTTQEPPAGFSVDRECELKASDESKAVVRYSKHPLDIEEIRQHIAQGKQPAKLALTWDDRVSFVLTEGLQLKKIVFQDVVFEGARAQDGGFDADVAIATGELGGLLPELIAALDGETPRGAAAGGGADF